MSEPFDPAKRASNIAKHGVDLADADQLEWETVLVRADVRFSYPEPRMVAMGLIGPRLYVLVFTVERRGLRAISLRKANNREIDRYLRETE
jgi:uncharacterized DUF497 family protein